MELNEFVKKFEAQLEDELQSPLTPETRFRELAEWDSMTGLVIISMVDREYNRQLTGDDLLNANTVEELFQIVINK